MYWFQQILLQRYLSLIQLKLYLLKCFDFDRLFLKELLQLEKKLTRKIQTCIQVIFNVRITIITFWLTLPLEIQASKNKTNQVAIEKQNLEC